jgi:hypothetical protein
MTQATCWDAYEYDELCCILSDYHKDVHGYRCRMWGEPREAVIAQLVALDDYMAAMKSTAEGRTELREQDWVF